MKSLLKIIFLLITGNSFGQNLVLNPGFEAHGEIAGNNPAWDNLRGNHVDKWYSATGGSCDYYLKSSYYLFNAYGKPQSKSGDAMAGMAVFGKNNYREYIEGELSEKLIQDSVYEFTVSIALAGDCGYGIDQIGIYFGEKMVYEKALIDPLKLIPQIVIDSTATSEIIGKWVTFHATYTATGGEKYFAIGNFQNDKKSSAHKTSKENSKQLPYAYYYIDDVSLIPEGNQLVEDFLIPDSTTEITDVIETPKDTLGIAPGKTLIANNVYFEVDKSILKEESFPILDEIISAMKDQPNLNVEIDGHTDTDGTDEHNQKLSEDRAKAVEAYFVSKGIDDGRIATRGFGRSKPILIDGVIDKNKSRRVEFVFSE
jgi:outer membrane protein OmpA-like peptidoglycan-associated protein